MLLLFRFLLKLLASRFRPRIGPFDESAVQFTVLPTDCDLNIHLNAGRFLSFMDVARMEWLGRTRMMLPVLRRGWRPIMGGGVIRYRRSILPFQRFTIRTRVLGWDAKWFYFEHIAEVDGTLCAIAYVRGLFRSKTASVEPHEFFGLMRIEDATSPELPEFVRRWRDAEDAR